MINTLPSLLLYFFIAFIALAVGSFLNVVIYRLPVMLEKRWQEEDNLNSSATESPPTTRFNLAWPSSHCSHCQHPLKAWQNIPLVSFFLLKGRCHYCQHRISWRYPLVETLTALLTLLVVIQFGFTFKALLACVFLYYLICLAFIDLQHTLLPDELTLTGVWLGLLANASIIFCTPMEAIYGAAFGYSLLWLIGTLFQRLRNKQGMGHGDYKMMAMLGAWLGVSQISMLLLVAVLSALVTSSILLLFKKITRDTPVPFGPFLAIAGAIFMVFSIQF